MPVCFIIHCWCFTNVRPVSISMLLRFTISTWCYMIISFWVYASEEIILFVSTENKFCVSLGLCYNACIVFTVVKWNSNLPSIRLIIFTNGNKTLSLCFGMWRSKYNWWIKHWLGKLLQSFWSSRYSPWRVEKPYIRKVSSQLLKSLSQP